MGFFEPKIEKIKRDELENLQNKKLSNMLTKSGKNVKMYQKKFNGKLLKEIKGIKDLHKIPFTTKNDLRLNSLSERLAVPYVDIIRFFSSSGTTGRPIVEATTPLDMEITSTCSAKSFSCCGITKHDRVLEPMPADGLRAVVVAQGGFEKIGAKIIHTGPGRTKELQIPILLGKFERDMRPTAIIGYANYMLAIAEASKDMGIEPQKFGIKKLLCGGEMWSQSRRKILEESYNAESFDILGMLEASLGPGIAAECEEHDGLHVWENYFIVEIIHPQTGEILGPGEEGELVITALEKDAHPLIRYRTGDITKILSYEKCNCGRTSVRLARIIGRSDDRLKVRGVQIYPKEIEDLLLGISNIGSEFKVILKEINRVDNMLITIESNRNFNEDSRVLAQTISNIFKGTFNFTPRIEVVPFGSLGREEKQKVKRFQDLRRK
jgi:phenylacetate-CoA ligase